MAAVPARELFGLNGRRVFGTIRHFPGCVGFGTEDSGIHFFSNLEGPVTKPDVATSRLRLTFELSCRHRVHRVNDFRKKLDLSV